MSLALPRERTLCIAVFAVCAALHLWFSSCGLRNSLMEGHEFRQAQTALNIQYLQRDGWRLDYPLPLFGPPWSAPMEFPLYQIVVVQVATLTGLPPEPAGRLVSLGAFYLALPAFFMLLGEFRLPSHRRWLFLAALLLSPVYQYYSRTVMIESTALCVSAWFLLGYCRTLDAGVGRWLGLAMVFGVTAALAKITTFIVFLTVAALYTLWRLRPSGSPRRARSRIAGLALAATVPAVVAGTIWVHYSDAVKASNPLSAFLASGPMGAFNFGTLAQRFSVEFWDRIMHLAADSVLTPIGLTCVLLFIVLPGRDYRLRLGLLFGGFFAGPLIFANLYFIHDYYFYATGVFLIAALALAWNYLLDQPAISAAGKWLVIALCLAAQSYSFGHSYFRLQDPRRPAPPALAAVLAAVTDPDDVVLVFGLEWNPLLAYYSNRRAIMVTSQYASDPSILRRVLERLPPNRVGAMVVVGEFRQNTVALESLAASLGLNRKPLLVSDEAQFYLAQRLVPPALKVLTNITVPGFILAVPVQPVVPGVEWQRYFVAKLPDQSPFDMMSPAPVEVLAPFGLSTSVVEGRRVYNAHAPTEVIFEVPTAARAIRFGFGLLPEAYEHGHSLDGVQFLIELIRPSGEHLVLFSQFLNPSARAEDRGLHRAEIPVPPGAQGRLVFSALPGPKNNISFNWAYWTDLSIK